MVSLGLVREILAHCIAIVHNFARLSLHFIAQVVFPKAKQIRLFQIIG